MRKRNSNYKFKGYDYAELFEKWGVKCEDYSNELEAYEEVLMNLPIGDDRKVYIKDMRQFLEHLVVGAEKYTYKGPIIRGLVEIKDDDTFLQLFACLLPHLWI